jgi:hypothetical protein
MRFLPPVLIALALAACGARRGPTFGDSFRLTRVEGQPMLLAPSVPAARPHAEPVQLAVGNPKGERAGCAEAGPLFRFAAARNGGWTATTPGPASKAAPEDIQRGLNEMLSRIDQLEARGCLPRGQGAVAGSVIEDTLAVKPNQALFYRMHYRPEGLMDLLPGVSIKVERAWFRAGEDGKIVKDVQHYIGVSTHHYEIERDPRGRLAMRLTASEKSTALPRDTRLPDARLATVVRPMPFARLFLLGEAVARRIDRVAMIVAAPTREALAAATEAIRRQPDVGCAPEALGRGLSCVTFEGSVVISPEVRVFRQGAPVLVAAGAELRNLPGLPSTAPAGLRVERLFHGAYYPVQFAPGDAAILTLSLASGDRIDW